MRVCVSGGGEGAIYGWFAPYIQCNLIPCQEMVEKSNGGKERERISDRKGD